MPCDSNHWLTGCTAGELQGTQHPSRWLGSGFGEKGLKIATKSIRELIHGLLMQQPQLHFRDWGGNQAIRPHPEHCINIAQHLGLKYAFFSLYLLWFWVSGVMQGYIAVRPACKIQEVNLASAQGLVRGSGSRRGGKQRRGDFEAHSLVQWKVLAVDGRSQYLGCS